jgi:hypothetical protein
LHDIIQREKEVVSRSFGVAGTTLSFLSNPEILAGIGKGECGYYLFYTPLIISAWRRIQIAGYHKRPKIIFSSTAQD